MGNDLSFSLLLYFMIDHAWVCLILEEEKDKLFVRQFVVKRLYRMDTSLVLLFVQMPQWPELQRPISLAMVVDPLSKIEEKTICTMAR